jgi:putative membrane protein insertion efficiency factor
MSATNMGARAKTFGGWSLRAFVQFYKIFFSPFLGGACKFYPSCSNYAQEAIELHGARRGAWLALKRLGRCRPFTKGGFDPVPDAEDLDAEWLRSGAPLVEAVQSKERAQ